MSSVAQDRVSKHYGATAVIDGLSLTIRAGAFAVLLSATPKPLSRNVFATMPA